ncbi:MAG TPA: alcohol dehydrogenase, partial [Phycisphaerales bacterium]|nr:alcohol dehydrogenase [Phycisphaerales bacterium]
MGQMHTIRILCCGADNLSVTATDVDDARLESLRAKAAPQAAARGVPLRIVNTQKNPLRETFSYFALMAPVGQLVADAIAASAPGTLINIFAGIPLPTKHELDLDTYIAHGCFMFGTSGSRIEDMRIVLEKVAAG